MYVGIAIAVPVILYEIWRFVTPGLTRSERRLIWPMLIGAILLFLVGMGLGYFVVPFALDFLLGLALPGVETQLRLSEYVSFVSTVLLAFGLAFQFPILLLLLARVGILNYRFLSARRRWAVLIIVLFAIIVTPGGDPAELERAFARHVHPVRGDAPDHSHHRQVSVWLLTNPSADVHRAPGHPERPERRIAVAEGVRAGAGAALREPASRAGRRSATWRGSMTLPISPSSPRPSPAAVAGSIADTYVTSGVGQRGA